MRKKLPRPSANMEEYNKIMQRGFERFPERRENYEKYCQMLKDGFKLHVDCMPIKMDYETSSICNFRCKMCLMADGGDNRPSQMKFSDYKASLDEQYGLIEVKLQGLGEPLLNPAFFAMVHETVARDIWVRTTTNGSLLHRNGYYKKMIDEKIGEIQVSIDGATKETFENIRAGSNFEQVVENVRMMNSYAQEKGEGWRASCWMLVQQDNFHEMEALLDLAEYMKFQRVVYSLAVGDWGGIGDWTEVNGRKDVRRQFTEDRGFRLMEIGKAKGIQVAFWDGKDKYAYTEKKDKLCAWAFSRAFVSGDMKIVPCCVVCDADTMELGDAMNFTEEWNGEKYLAFRKAHLEGHFPSICKNCYQ